MCYSRKRSLITRNLSFYGRGNGILERGWDLPTVTLSGVTDKCGQDLRISGPRGVQAVCAAFWERDQKEDHEGGGCCEQGGGRALGTVRGEGAVNSVDGSPSCLVSFMASPDPGREFREEQCLQPPDLLKPSQDPGTSARGREVGRPGAGLLDLLWCEVTGGNADRLRKSPTVHLQFCDCQGKQ